MAASILPDAGLRPDVVLLHGVGVGPGSFDRLRAAMADGHRTVALERPVARDGSGLPLDDQADRLAGTLVGLGFGGGLVVGVSGGATLALVLALRHPDVVGALVLHEPLVGSHAARLHDRFALAAARASRSDDAAMEIVRSVMGERTWQALTDEERAASLAEVGRWRTEIGHFAAFDPLATELASLRSIPVLTTTGARSSEDRRVAAEVLHRLAGAEVAVVPGAGNAVQLDAPDVFADLIGAWQPAPTGPAGGR